MAKEVRDAAYWQRAREEMNAFHDAKKAEFEELERQKQEILARRRAEELARSGHVVDIRWNSVAVPTTSGAGGYMVTIAAPPPRRRRWRWF
jgi:hypothetical protein